MNKFFSWVYQPVSRKVSFLSATLLSFVLIVIVYSIVRISDIRLEMQEIAEIDIPLSEVVAEVEILQLELHLLMEKMYLKQLKNVDTVLLDTELLLAKYQQVNVNLEHHLNKANSVLDIALENKHVVDDLVLHEQTQNDLHTLKQRHNEFNKFVTETLSMLVNQPLTEKKWQILEKTFIELDSNTDQLLKQVELLLNDVAKKTKEHTEHFYWVLISLGFSAFIIGAYITVYTVRFIHSRFTSLHKQISSAKAVLSKGKHVSDNSHAEDEFDKLSKEIQSLVDVYSGELASRQVIEQGLLKLVVTDKLTGAYNRHKWQETIDLELAMLTRNNSFSVIHVDLDHFKAINDTYGHNTGDEVLKQAVLIIKSIVRESDAVFRMGGEEFIILLRQARIDDAKEVAEKVRIAYENFRNDHLPSFTASFGVSQSQSQDTEKQLLERVDNALYQAKHNGRNKVIVA